jgi:hypothetical protein
LNATNKARTNYPTNLSKMIINSMRKGVTRIMDAREESVNYNHDALRAFVSLNLLTRIA